MNSSLISTSLAHRQERRCLECRTSLRSNYRQSPSMAPVRRRGRTGCLTCRARRLKCDERKPTCERCEIANYDCAGYEEKRQAPALKRPPRRDQKTDGHANGHARSPAGQSTSSLSEASPTPQNGITSPASKPASCVTEASPLPWKSDSPLVAFPSNPRPFQRPGPGARHVLGYHQSLIRTLPMLFPADDLYFWRDELCQEAWGSEYIYLTLTALGCLHRSVLTCSQSGGVCDNKSGLDIKITAVQIYTQALQELASHIEEVKATPRLLVGVLCLMAYFEASRFIDKSLTLSELQLTSRTVIQRKHTGLYGPCPGCKPLLLHPSLRKRTSICERAL
jgi:hypothetical protein